MEESGSAPTLNDCTFHPLVSANCPLTRAVISDVGILVRIISPTESSIALYLVRIAGEVSLLITPVSAANWLRPSDSHRQQMLFFHGRKQEPAHHYIHYHQLHNDMFQELLPIRFQIQHLN